MKYGLISYDLNVNIGEEIQSIAARQFLPQIDYYINKEKMDRFKADEKVKMIVNGWFMHFPDTLPPSESINPLFISIHVNKDDKRVMDGFFNPKSKEYFKQHGPVGCRDTSTYELFKENGIPAYYSGCLTLTLTRNKNISRKDYILAVDLPKEMVDYIKSKTNRPVYSLHHYYSMALESKDKFTLAEYLLTLYQEAHCVVTSRLHVALPCIAFETPTLLIDTAKDQFRFSGLNELVRHCKVEEYLNDYSIFDLDNPGENPNDYLKYRNEMIKKCQEFIGTEIKDFNISTNSHIQEGSINAAFMEILHKHLRQRSKFLLKTFITNKFKKKFKSLRRKVYGINKFMKKFS